MSNIYIQEPPTSGKVLLKTTVGDIEIELWAKETPKACRNFIQLCLEGYYDNCLFHRVVKGFIAQGGDPTGTGEGGESIYGEPFKDEFHSRLRFVRRGLVAMANAGKDDNGSQFFFTFAPAPELQNKHTIFGKVAGETIYNMIKLEDVLIDENDRPTYPQKILKTTVITNPFDDLIPRCDPRQKSEQKSKKKRDKGVKDFKLLSFGEEAEEDEEETIVVAKKLSGKSKSAHDNLADPKLSSETEETIQKNEKPAKSDEDSSDYDSEQESSKRDHEEMKGRIMEKLKTKKRKVDEIEKVEEPEEAYYLGKDRDDEKKRQLEEIRKEYRGLQREIKSDKHAKQEEELREEEEKKKKEKKSELLQEYLKTQEEFKQATAKNPKKGPSRDNFTIQLLQQFKSKIRAVANEHEDEVPEAHADDEEEKMLKDGSYLAHALRAADSAPILAKDASSKGDDWFEIYDPRNPLNKRRRGETSKKPKNK